MKRLILISILCVSICATYLFAQPELPKINVTNTVVLEDFQEAIRIGKVALPGIKEAGFKAWVKTNWIFFGLSCLFFIYFIIRLVVKFTPGKADDHWLDQKFNPIFAKIIRIVLGFGSRSLGSKDG